MYPSLPTINEIPQEHHHLDLFLSFPIFPVLIIFS
jgi:hypothetical protein